MTTHWQTVLRNLWGIDAALTPLDGEFDLNFLATGAGGHVLKLSLIHI